MKQEREGKGAFGEGWSLGHEGILGGHLVGRSQVLDQVVFPGELPVTPGHPADTELFLPMNGVYVALAVLQPLEIFLATGGRAEGKTREGN